MRNSLRSLITLILSVGICLPVFSLDAPGQTQLISFNQVYEGAVVLSKAGPGFSTFTMQIDPDIFAVEIRLKKSQADLDIYLRRGGPITDYTEVDASRVTGAYNETLFLSRLSRRSLENGTYYIDIVYQGKQAPLREYQRMARIPFDIEVRSITAGKDSIVREGNPVFSELRPEEGMAKTFELRIPGGVEECRVDLFDAAANLDILVGFEKPVLSRQNADYIGDRLIGNESLVFTGTSRTRVLPAGSYYITVFDPGQARFPETFSMIVTMDKNPPDRLLSIPRFPLTDDELQHTLHSTVEVAGDLGRGSGCLVSGEGLVLTSWHVVRGFSGGPSEDIYISASFSQQTPPQELFKAKVLEYDAAADLALLEIETGMYGQPLPYDYKFPYIPLGQSQELGIGQPVSIIGYPGAGGNDVKVSVSLSRGIISGFEQRGGVPLIKTDSLVLPGNSGGAVINPYFELVGIVTYSLGDAENRIGYIYPVSGIPESWLSIIMNHNNF